MACNNELPLSLSLENAILNMMITGGPKLKDKETLLEEQSDEYENVVKMDYSWKCVLMDGNEGAFCKCGMVLQIKRPKVKAWHKIKCPKCGFIINIFCGEY